MTRIQYRHRMSNRKKLELICLACGLIILEIRKNIQYNPRNNRIHGQFMTRIQYRHRMSNRKKLELICLGGKSKKPC